MPAITTITDPSGTDWVLDGTNGVWEQPGKKGFHAPTYQHYRDESPAVSGAYWRGVRTLPRELTLPVVIRQFDRNVMLSTRRSLIAAIGPEEGECVITSAWPDGSARHIRCRYVDGMDLGEQGPGEYGVTTIKYSLRFMADDPYFYGDEIAQDYQLVASSRTELPIPGADTFFEVVTSPLLSGGGVLETNPGDVAAYPIWSFSGPYTSIVVANATTGKTFTITYTAATTSNRLDLVTEPGKSYLVDENGVNRWSTLTAGYQLWPLAKGDNILNISLTGADATSVARLRYVPLYKGD